MNAIPTGLVVSCLSVALAAPAPAQSTQRASVDSNGAQENNYSGLYGSSISADGRFVAFNSGATNLNPGGSPLQWEIYLHDFLTGATSIVSVDSSGNIGSGGSYTPSISADGTRIAFNSDSGFNTGDSNGRPDVFLHDTTSGLTTLISADANGNQFVGQCGGAAISADGRYVAFNVVVLVGRYGHKTNTYVKDTQTGALVCASVDPNGVASTKRSGDPALDGDGGLVVFSSNQDSLVSGDANGHEDIVLRDLAAGVSSLASVDSSGAQGNGDSSDPAISADGRYVAFVSAATNLVAGDTNGFSDIFVHDLQTGATVLASVDSAGTQADADCLHPSLSADGRYVGFESAADNLVAGDTNKVGDIFLHDLQTGVTTCLSVSTGGTIGNHESYTAQISADGRAACFTSYADNLVANDTDLTIDVFEHGAWLTVEAAPSSVTAGDTLTLSSWRAQANAPLMLAVVDVNGTPTFLPVLFTNCDGTGAWSLSSSVPDGLAGTAIGLETLAIVDTGKVDRSNVATITIQ